MILFYKRKQKPKYCICVPLWGRVPAFPVQGFLKHFCCQLALGQLLTRTGLLKQPDSATAELRHL